MSYTFDPSPGGSTRPSLLPSRLTLEMALVLGAALWLFGAVSLFSHSLSDPAWSTSGLSPVAEANWGGLTGAWLADLHFVVLGYSAWWLLLLGAHWWWQGFMRWIRMSYDWSLAQVMGSPLRLFMRLTALCLLLVSSSAIEWSRLHRWDEDLPSAAGGLLGAWAGAWMQRWLGDTGLALFCLSVMCLSVAGVFGFSWGPVAESLGEWLLNARQRWRNQWEVWSDLRVGRRLARERSEPLVPEPGLAMPMPSPMPMPVAKTVAPRPAPAAPAAAPTPTTAPVPASEADEGPPPWHPDASLPPSLDLGYADPVPLTGVPAVESAPNDHKPSVARSRTPAPAPAPAAPAPHVTLPPGDRPDVRLLDPPARQQTTVSPETLEVTSRLIEKKLGDFGVTVKVVAALPGPVITRYEIEPATGVKGSQVVNLAKDLARSLSLVSIRVIETIPGKNLMALELPNARRQIIHLSEVLGSQVYHEARSLLTVALGKDIAGQPVVADLARMPHCLVAGTTGSGKSVGVNAMILSMLFKADASQVRMMLIDPKMLELSVYEGIPHLLCPVVTDMKQAANGLNWCVGEMEKRYRLMSKMGVRNLAGFNARLAEAEERGETIGNPFSLTPEAPEPLKPLPHIVVVIDELADLMMVVGKKIEELIARLAQKARASGIHLILATQRPSVDVITGLIKANIPTRLSFQVSSKVDSRTILDQMGAETLLGMGDMLFMPSGTGYPTRVHGAFVSDDEVHRVAAFLKEQGGEPEYVEGILEGSTEGDGGAEAGVDGDSGGEKDPLYDQAVAVVLQDRKASISYVQRKLKIGYNRAARLLEDMENAGLVSALTSSGQRDILVAQRATD